MATSGWRLSAVLLGVLASLFIAFGPLVSGGLPRQEVCVAGGACSVSLDWGGLVPTAGALVTGLPTGLLVAVLVLVVAALWRQQV